MDDINVGAHKFMYSVAKKNFLNFLLYEIKNLKLRTDTVLKYMNICCKNVYYSHFNTIVFISTLYTSACLYEYLQRLL